MRIARRIVVGLMIFLTVIISAGFLLPRTVHIERSIEIDAPAAEVFDRVNRLQSWQAWTPWGPEEDPSVEMTYGGAEQGVGAWFAYTSDMMGAGRLTITNSDRPRQIDYELIFIEQQQTTAGRMTFAESAGKTTVTWQFDADMGMNPISRYMGLVLDRLLGDDLQRGLENLKRVSEGQAKGT